MSKNTVVIGIVDSEVRAENIVQRLNQAGFSSPDISVMFPDKHGTRDFAHEHHTKAPEGAVTGVAGGGVVGGTLGLLAGIGALAIPGLGPFIAAGPLMAALSGAAAGAALGGLTGALIGLGIPEIEAKAYEGKLKGGGVLVAAHVDSADRERMAKDIFRKEGASDVSSTREASVPTKPEARRNA
jgi:hypothetical protein